MNEFAAPPVRWRSLLPVAVPVVLVHAALGGVSISHAETAPAPVRAPAAMVRVVDAPAPAPAPEAAPPATPKPRVATAKAAPAEPHKITAPTTADAPVYRTRIPPSQVMRYVISRGPWSGNGELTWEVDGPRYKARLEGRVAGIKVITQESTGQIDNAGIAPVRFTDERRGKSVMAANFQRSAGKITYSGPSNEYALVPGSQDRLSWMIQIGAIVGADPQKASPGKKLGMFVSGARGDADVWTFQAIGTENVAIGGASVSAIKFTRDPRKVNDTQVEVWLDPQNHYLPVRARMTNQPEGDVFELVRRPSDPS